MSNSPATEVAIGSERTALDGAAFRHVIGHFASGVTVITVADEASRYGATASAVCSLSLDPPMLLVCLHRSIETSRAIARTGHFVVNILGEQQPDLALHFASKIPNKYESLRGIVDIDGQPALSDTLAQLRCNVAEIASGGTHSIFLARVVQARLGTGAPLAYFRGSFGRFVEIKDDTIYRNLRSAILDRRYRLDEVLNVDVLARDLAVDRASVVYALTRLTQEGIVGRDTQNDYHLTPVDESLLRKTIDARRALTIGVVDTIIDSLTDPEIEGVRAAAEKTIPTGIDNDADVRSREAVHAFHSHLIGLSANPIIIDLYSALTLPSILTRTLLGVDWSKLQKQLSDQYIKLGDALVRRNRADAFSTINRYSQIASEECARFLQQAGGRV